MCRHAALVLATMDARQAFVNEVKRIDPLFRRGDLKAFWPALRRLVAQADDRVDVSRKKSHYLASLAARSLARDDSRSALAFLDLADRALDPVHLTPFLLEERVAFREKAVARSRRPP